ncbi:tRNA wybutosine-synthesizing protein like [Melia azedarach]|uniref:tRNA wybutosine-synthesizing protein like n=1 Tax=Melia azedarach TaxID=155640 RepID=A0ACC1YS67_MELAZ|nr:tRNA wybutosine-synthesizing protein like [Melia azedarach]
MASLLSQNLACINGVDDDHVFRHNSLLLMSLLEETQGDQLYYTEEDLHNMIRSLEAEINPSTSCTMEEEVHDFAMESRLLIDEVEFMDCQDSSDSINGLDDVAWDNDDDDHMEQASSCSSSDDLNLCMDFHGSDEMEDMVEFGVAVDAEFSDQLNCGVSLEDHVYTSVWHETIIY